jgi:hypothetical protein
MRYINKAYVLSDYGKWIRNALKISKHDAVEG